MGYFLQFKDKESEEEPIWIQCNIHAFDQLLKYIKSIEQKEPEYTKTANHRIKLDRRKFKSMSIADPEGSVDGIQMRDTASNSSDMHDGKVKPCWWQIPREGGDDKGK